MSIYNCHKQQPQPWMSYISPSKIVFPGECCPALVTGDRCDVVSTEVVYGYLYNWYAATDARDIANTGWYVPTIIEISSLYTFADGSADGGGKLKETGLIYWNNPNTGATNDYKFNARGGGQRVYNTGLFTDLKNVGVLWTATANDLITARCWGVQTTTQTILLYTIKENMGGIGVRLLRPATAAEQLLTDGTACDPYVGNDGKVYRTVKIDTQVWLADNLCETRYRNGDPIPEVTDNATWAALTTGARCSYDNTESYALSETTVCGQALLPFQVISNGDFVRMEYSLYDEDTWYEITLPITTVMTDGFYIHSYNGEPLDTELPCGVYKFRLVAGETWWFEPIMIQDFEIVESEFSVVDDMMLPLKFSEQIADTTPLIAPCDTILPFMFRTENVTSGVIAVTMVDTDGAETALPITVSTAVIDGMTYYWHRGECLYPFLTCGRYYLKIVDGANTYYSVPFVPECGISDIPDGNEALIDVNGCVMRDTDGNILYEPC